MQPADITTEEVMSDVGSKAGSGVVVVYSFKEEGVVMRQVEEEELGETKQQNKTH